MSSQPTADPSARSLLDPEDAHLIDAFVEERREAAHIPGVAVVILEGGSPVHQRGYGLADVAAGTPMSSETLVGIGSNTVGMTALAALQQIAAGTLDLDAPVAQVLPWFDGAGGGAGSDPAGSSAGSRAGTPAGRGGAVTLRRLLAHTAGLPKHTATASGGRQATDGRAVPAADASDASPSLEAHVRALAAPHAADAPFAVSDDGYAVAGLLIERATATPFEVAMQDHLFAPLGMHDARFAAPEPVAGQAQGYRRERGATVPAALSDGPLVAPAAGVLASARDLGRYLAALLTRRVPGVTESLLREAWTPQAEIRDGVHYGFGWFLTRSGDMEVVAHPGELAASGSSFLLLPRLGTAVAVLTNLNSAAKDEIARGIAAILLGDEPAPSQLRPERPPSGFEPDRRVWRAYAGAFEAPQGTLQVSIDGDVLRGTLLGQSFELEPFSDTDFVARSSLPALDGAAVAFRHEDDGRLTVLVQGRPFASR